MGIKKPWSRFTLENVEKVPEKGGAYELGYSYKGRKRPGYIGSSEKNLRSRLKEHKRKRGEKYFRYIVSGLFDPSPSALEKKLFEDYAAKKPAKPPGSKKAPKKVPFFY